MKIDRYDPKEETLVGVPGCMPGIIVPDMPAEEEKIALAYLYLAKYFGLLWSNPHLGSIIVSSALMRRAEDFVIAEREYVRLGYKPISLTTLSRLVGYHRPLPEGEGFCQKLTAGQEPPLVAPAVVAFFKSRPQKD